MSVALVAATLPVAALASGCGGDDPGSSGAGAGGPGGFEIGIELPPDTEARLLELVTELGAAICERARSCCDDYGLAPRTDCTQLGGEVFLPRLLEGTDLGTKDASELDFTIDEAQAERCLEIARSVSNKCVFTGETVFAWFGPCSSALIISPKGEAPVDCYMDRNCERKLGPGHGCVANTCRPMVDVEQGASCERTDEGSTIPVCAASERCDSGTCEPRTPVGEACLSSEECVPGAYCDTESAERTCATRLQVGAPCESDSVCAEGLRCACATSGCEESACIEDRDVGEPCSVDAQCPLSTRCEDGICKSSSIGFCAPP
ncbi:dickkopf-related protein [Sorangium sp. So ce1078]|uniref:dickkopf-related protein n=1 Tax=Sorangium sp. So ce1078 TaxID=3133329 RepID=UPI003F6249AD